MSHEEAICQASFGFTFVVYTPVDVCYGVCVCGSDSECVTVSQNEDIQSMSVSEDDESSGGDTDYVILGEPVSRHCALRQSGSHHHQ